MFVYVRRTGTSIDRHGVEIVDIRLPVDRRSSNITKSMLRVYF